MTWIAENFSTIRFISAWDYLFDWTPEERKEIDCMVEGLREVRLAEFSRKRLPRPEVDAKWAREAKIAYCNEQLDLWTKQFMKFRIAEGRAAQEGLEVSRLMNEDWANNCILKIKKFTKTIESMKKLEASESGQMSGHLSDEMIEAARQAPMSAVMEIPASKKVRCPFPEGHKNGDNSPSMYCYDTACHCFACGKHLNAIRWLVEVEGLSYPDAVRKLQ